MRSIVPMESKLTGEIKKYAFDFANYMPDLLSGEAIVSTTVSISVYTGVADVAASAMVVNTYLPGLTIVYVKLRNGVVGNIYQVLCTVDILFSGITNTITLGGYLAVPSEVL